MPVSVPPIADPDERAALERFLRNRSEPDFRFLYRQHTPALYGFVGRLVAGNRAELDDVVQETWLRAVTRLEGFRGDSSLRTWLRSIAFNVYREWRRKPARREAPLEPESPQLRVVEPPREGADRLDLQAAIDQLSPGYREVLLLHDVEGFTHAQIGELLGIEPGTSKSQLSRARRALREVLAERGTDEEAKGRV